MDEILEVKNKIDIVELLGEYIELKKAGRNYKANCPFHGEKTPSFMVSSELQIYKCFGCQAGGDAFAFLMQMEGMTFGEALKFLAGRTGVKLTEFKPSREGRDRERLISANNLAAEFYHFLLIKHGAGKKALAYLKERGIEDRAIETFKLGWAPDGWDSLARYLISKKGYQPEELVRAGLAGFKSSSRAQVGKIGISDVYDRFRRRIIFPIRNHRGETVGFSGRLLPGDIEEGKTGKYINTSETELYHKSEILYGLDVTRGAIKRSSSALVVEGELDLITPWQRGSENVVAIKGSAVTEGQVKLLKRFCQEIVLALDSDTAGDAAARRGIQVAEKEGFLIKVIKLEKYKDPDEFARADLEGWKRAVAGAIGIYDFYLDSAVARFGVKSAEGKSKVGAELLPIYGQISDEIVKAHYVGKIARTLDVSEEIVWKQMEKVTQPNTPGNKTAEETREAPGKTRREMFEEYLLALALSGKINQLLSGGVRDLVEGGWGKRVIEEIEKNRDLLDGDKIDAKKFLERIPEELKAGVGKLWLLDLPDDRDWREREWEKILVEIRRVDLRGKLKGLEEKIAVGEKSGEETGNLQEEFAKASKNLTDVV